VQGWLSFWFEEQKRLEAAKTFQKARIIYLRSIWSKSRDLKQEGFMSDDQLVQNALDICISNIEKAGSVGKLLQLEADLTKNLCRLAANITNHENFKRNRESTDLANDFLNHGNYLAYGLAACTLWVLGIPHGFAVMHGKTRRGALVFDIADLVKDAIVLPWAFICAKENATDQEFRQQCLQAFADHKALDFMFDQVKDVALKNDWELEQP
jgi:CRISPR-associated protein Cas1